jgi:hypothetical protein
LVTHTQTHTHTHTQLASRESKVMVDLVSKHRFQMDSVPVVVHRVLAEFNALYREEVRLHKAAVDECYAQVDAEWASKQQQKNGKSLTPNPARREAAMRRALAQRTPVPSAWKRGVTFIVGKGPSDGVDRSTGEEIVGLPSFVKRKLDAALLACSPRIASRYSVTGNKGMVFVSKSQLKKWAAAGLAAEGRASRPMHQQHTIRPREEEIRPRPTRAQRRDNRESVNVVKHDADLSVEHEEWFSEVNAWRSPSSARE